MTTGGRATVGLVVAVLAVVAGLAVAPPAAVAPTADCGDGPGGGALYTTDTGLEVVDDAQARPIGGAFVNRATLRFENVTVTARGRATLRLESVSVATVCVAALNATTAPVRLAVNGTRPIVVDGRADGLAIGATDFDRTAVGPDLAYASNDSLQVRWPTADLAAGTSVQAVATDSGSVLAETTVDDAGGLTLRLPAGQATVDVTVASPSVTTTTPANVTTVPGVTPTPSGGTATPSGEAANESIRRPPEPVLVVTPQSLHVGNGSVDTTTTRSVTVSNPASSGTGVRVTTTRVTGRDAAAFAITDGAPFTLAPGEQRDLDISFRPNATRSEQVSIQAQLQLRSNVTDAQVDVWLSTGQMVVDVQSVATETGVDPSADTVRIEAVNVPRGEVLVVNVTSPRLQSRTAHMSRIETAYREGGNVTLEVTHSRDPVGEDGAVYESTDRQPLQYLSIAHSVPESAFSETGFTIRVNKSRFPEGASPEELSVARFDNGTWNEQTVTLAGESANHYVYEVDANGLSQFVVTAPAVSVNERSLVGPGLPGVVLVAGAVVFGFVFVLYRRRDGPADLDAGETEPDDDR